MRAFSLILLCVSVCPLQVASAFDWQTLPTGRWVVVPTQGEAAPKVFHGGATIAAERGEVFFFGSDTHSPTPLERGETNALWRLNLDNLTWQQDYEQEPLSAFGILPDGQCVTESGKPWAMHTFDQVEYDPEAKKVVVVSLPKHARFRPEERFPAFQGDWFQKLKPSHWEYDPDTKQWERLETDPPDIFAKGLAWDPDRHQLIAHDGEKSFHFERDRGKWKSFDAASSSAGYHLTLVYDTVAAGVLLLGRNGGSDILYRYAPDAHQWAAVETHGATMPANGATMAFDSRNGILLYLANQHDDQYHNPTGKAVTFIYHARDQRWERLDIESPELYGMNYLMQYDPVRNVVLHFEKSRETGDRIRVWAFRYR